MPDLAVALEWLVLSSAICARTLVRISRAHRLLRSEAYREDLWQHLLLADFPSSSSVLGLLVDIATGRGHRWLYALRCRPVHPLPSPAPLPPPSFGVSDLVLLVEIRVHPRPVTNPGESLLVLTRAVQGAGLHDLLSAGKLTIPVPAKALTCALPDLPVEEESGKWDWDAFGLEDFDVRFLRLNDYSCSVQLMRVTDHRLCCLMDDQAERDHDGARAGHDGHGWRGCTPALFPSEMGREFDRDLDLVERLAAGLMSRDIPMVTGGPMGAAVAARLKQVHLKGISCHLDFLFKVPRSPRYFVYDQLALNGHGKDARVRSRSELLKNHLCVHLARQWRQLCPSECRAAERMAGCEMVAPSTAGHTPPPDDSINNRMSDEEDEDEAKAKLCDAHAELDTIQVQLWAEDTDGFASELEENSLPKAGLTMLHVLDALSWHDRGACQ